MPRHAPALLLLLLLSACGQSGDLYLPEEKSTAPAESPQPAIPADDAATDEKPKDAR